MSEKMIQKIKVRCGDETHTVIYKMGKFVFPDHMSIRVEFLMTKLAQHEDLLKQGCIAVYAALQEGVYHYGGDEEALRKLFNTFRLKFKQRFHLFRYHTALREDLLKEALRREIDSALVRKLTEAAFYGANKARLGDAAVVQIVPEGEPKVTKAGNIVYITLPLKKWAGVYLKTRTGVIKRRNGRLAFLIDNTTFLTLDKNGSVRRRKVR